MKTKPPLLLVLDYATPRDRGLGGSMSAAVFCLAIGTFSLAGVSFVWVSGVELSLPMLMLLAAVPTLGIIAHDAGHAASREDYDDLRLRVLLCVHHGVPSASSVSDLLGL